MKKRWAFEIVRDVVKRHDLLKKEKSYPLDIYLFELLEELSEKSKELCYDEEA